MKPANILPILLSPILLLLAFVSAVAQPAQWKSIGIGGGGALFASSQSPHDQNVIYLSCDMSEVFRSADFGASWETLDFRRLQGGATAGAIRFTSNPNILYTIDGYNDGAWPVRSTDGGTTWTTLADDPTGGEAFALYADPTGTTRVILSDYYNLYFSSNGGATFETVYTTDEASGIHVAGAFFDGTRIMVGTNLGLFQSIDGGTSFTIAAVNGMAPGEAIVSFAGAKQGNSYRLLCVTLNDVDIYAGITGADYYGYTNIYRLDQGETTWTSVKAGIPGGAYPFFVDMARNDIGVAYVAGGSDDGVPVVYKTTNGGGAWQSVLTTANNGNVRTGWSGDGGDRGWSYGEYALGLSVSPVNPNRVVLTDLGFAHVTTDGGAQWKQAYLAASGENPQGAKTPKMKPYSGVGLENTTSWWVAWADKDNIVGCFADIRGVRSSDGGRSWLHPFDAFSFNATYHVSRHPATGNLYAATSSVHDLYQSTYLTDARIDGGKGEIIVSTDKGATWSVLHDFAHPVVWTAIDPNNPNTMYASVVHSTQGGIYVTKNLDAGAGSTWSRLAAPPRTEGHPLNIHVLKDGTLLATYSGRRAGSPQAFTASSGVFVSTNGGTSWVDRSSPRMLYWTKDVVVDPHDQAQNTWYAGVWSGYGGAPNGLGGLYRTTNRGTSWSILLDLPSKEENTNRVTSCTVSPTDPAEMYVTTETDGLWYTKNLTSPGPTFTQVAGYPFRQPERVFYNPYAQDDIWVTSFGNGMRRTGTTPAKALPGAVTLFSPANNATSVPFLGTLSWLDATDADDYHVQLSTSPDFSSMIIDKPDAMSTDNPYGILAPGTKHYWRVRGVNSLGNGPWSEIWSFTTVQEVPPLPEAPVLLSPADQAVDVPTTFTLQWSQPLNGEVYRVQLSTAADFATTVVDESGLTSTSYQFTGLADETVYYWRVSATNTVGTGPWSEVRSFTTGSTSAAPVTGDAARFCRLAGIYPNPASNDAAFDLRLARDAHVGIRLMNMKGEEVGSVEFGELTAGTHRLRMEAADLPSGVYYAEIRVAEETLTGVLHVVR